jgi:Tfp pilus assembly protein PilX
MKRFNSRPRRGSTLILTLVFVVMFSALAVAMAGMSGVNVQVAKNQLTADNVRGSAESGQEVVRYWLNGVSFTGTTAPEQRLEMVAATLQNNLAVAGITNILPVLSGSTITITNVPLNSFQGQSFSAVMTMVTDDRLQVDVTGQYRGISRTLRSDYMFSTRADNVFDYGLASKGPMHLTGNLDVTVLDNQILVEFNALIVTSLTSSVALTMEGRSKIDGAVTLTDLTDNAIIGNNAWIGGLKGTNAYQNIFYDDTYVEFPEMQPSQFYAWATNPLTTATPTGGTWDNLVIPPGLNPTFSGGAKLRGVIYIQTPNIVTFGGGTTITGVIVTNGDPSYFPDPDAPDNAILFGSNVNSMGVDELPPEEPQFAGLQDLGGTFIVAPGFRVVFTGTFGILSGAIGCNGFYMSGGSGGIVSGSIINYADNEMYLSGNGNVSFNRSGTEKVPAGFVPQTVLRYDPSSYKEVTL